MTIFLILLKKEGLIKAIFENIPVKVRAV